MTENDKQHQLESVTTESQPSVEQFPTENFVCPACGQLLGPACRVCVACKRAIDPAELRKPQVLPAIAMPERRELEPVRFSWRTFVIVFAIWVVGATLVQSRMPPTRAQLVLGGVQILCSLWVLFDALQKGLPRPFRWGMGTLLLWPVIFPWYLARRVRPRQPCPFIEGRVSPRTLAVLIVLLVILFYVIYKFSPQPNFMIPSPHGRQINASVGMRPRVRQGRKHDELSRQHPSYGAQTRRARTFV